jgi:Type I phosphodiesterase / nucleotide pyrophosphatase
VIVPSYGGGALPDLSASVAASVGIPGFPNVLGFDRTSHACVLVVDGLGWEQLRDHPAVAPFLSELAMNARPVSAGFPSTTVTSLGSLCTGTPPGTHGMLGYQVRVPDENRLLNLLRWDKKAQVDPYTWQPQPTIYQRAEAAGVPAFHVAEAAFRGTCLTTALMRGARYQPANTMGELAAQAAAALTAHRRAFAIVYHGDLDGTGHRFGTGSDAWVRQLAHVDKLAEHLAAGLPSGGTLTVTADHGMVNVGPDDRIDLDETPALREGVALLGGEPRARHVYAQPGAEGDVLAAWRETLGDRAWVLSRDEAIKEGWFGQVDPAMVLRIGDVVAAPSGVTALVATKAEPKESSLYGLHGSLTPSEQLVPALRFTAP